MKILQIGCGAMGTPILINCKKYYNDITLLTIGTRHIENIKCINSFNKIQDEKFDIILIAIKPQQFNEISQKINEITDENTIIVSIMAAITTDYLAKKISNTKNFIRVMPNLGMMLKSGGISLVYYKVEYSKETKCTKIVENIFGESSILSILPHEQSLDAFTPITGCGIAYFALFGTLLEQWSETSSIQIIRKLMENTVELSEQCSFQEIIDKISSKGGVTEAVINAMKDKMKEAIKEGLKAGELKIQELQKD